MHALPGIMRLGERARPRAHPTGASPVGSEAPTFSERFALAIAPKVAGEAPATAPGAGALPNRR